MKFSIVIPCYNESKNIPLILEKFNDIIDCDNIEIILVNNGSTDNSAEVLDTLLPKYNFAKLVYVPVNQGYGYGILQGLKAADADYIGWTHADMQTDPKDVLHAKKIIEENKTNEKLFVKGIRKNRPLFDRFFSFGMGLFESILLKQKMKEINAQPTIFPKSFFESWQDPPHDFSLDLYAYYLACKSDCKIVRFDVLFPPRIHGESKWNTGLSSKWKFIKRTLNYSIELNKRGIK